MKKSWPLLSKALIVAVGSVVFGGCVVYDRYPPIPISPPPPIEPVPMLEAVPASPGPGYVWVSGGWVWHDRWIWRRGYWAAGGPAPVIVVPGPRHHW